MTQTEAWIVTALGMTVVFIGLLLCVAFIQLFSRLSARISWGEAAHGASAPAPAPAAPQAIMEPVPADILAVIATVIEVERKLYVSRPDARRPALQS
jgi:Na+-transporting methylmalonyl-CoA/oxaloacetate decarboxylase gamma subunit